MAIPFAIGRMERAGVAELVDAPDLGSGAVRRGGSSPFTRTISKNTKLYNGLACADWHSCPLMMCLRRLVWISPFVQGVKIGVPMF